jgi:hypothetical protein
LHVCAAVSAVSVFLQNYLLNDVTLPKDPPVAPPALAPFELATGAEFVEPEALAEGFDVAVRRRSLSDIHHEPETSTSPTLM